MITHILLDFDHCLAQYKCDNNRLDQDMVKKFTYIMNKRGEKINLNTSRSELKMTWNEVIILLRYIVSYYRPNRDIINLVKTWKTAYPDAKVVIVTNTMEEVVNEFLDIYDDIRRYEFSLHIIFTPEKLNWHTKNKKEFYDSVKYNLQGAEFPNMLLIDDDISNIQMFKSLGGQTILKPSQEQFRI